jgi:TolA-binding protein
MRSIVFVATTSLISMTVLSGCLQTRNEVRENEHRHVIQQQVSTLQQTNANVSNRFAEIEEEMRSLHGRVEVIENKMDQSHSILEGTLKSNKQQGQDMNEKLSALQDALVKMEKEMNTLSAEFQAFKANVVVQASAPSVERNNHQLRKDSFELAQDLFIKKDWKQAILQFEKYREEKPKGPHFSDATYKIGVSFQELGMDSESKVFFEEVISKFPKSDDARRAKIRLKSLKK